MLKVIDTDFTTTNEPPLKEHGTFDAPRTVKRKAVKQPVPFRALMPRLVRNINVTLCL